MMQITAQSNLVSNNKYDAYHRALNFVANECLLAISPAYGPMAKDQLFATKDGKFIFTKDGKELLQALEFDNDLCNLIKSVILDAATVQGDKKGDSSTTLTIFTCLCINHILQQLKVSPSTTMIDTLYNDLRDQIIAIEPMKLDTNNIEMITNLMFSVTRDYEITQLCVEPFYQVEGVPFVSFQKDGLSNKMTIEKEMEPKIMSRVTYSPLLEYFNKFDFSDARVFLVNGSLDIVDEELLDIFIATATVPTIIIAQNMTPDTSRLVKSLTNKLQRKKLTGPAEQVLSIKNNKEVMPFIVMAVDDSLKLNSEFFRGLSTVLYGSDNFQAIQGVSFDVIMKESLKLDRLYTYVLSVFQPETEDAKKYSSLIAHNLDLSKEAIELITSAASKTHSVNYSENKVHLKNYVLSTEAVNLKVRLETEMNSPSAVTSNKAKEVYRALFGSFIKINIGSDLALDRSNKYELVKDAVLTGKNAIEFGVVQGSIIRRMYFTTKGQDRLKLLNNIFGEMLTISQTMHADDMLVLDAYDSVMAALDNGYKTAKMLIESSSAIVRNLHNINKPVDIVNSQTKGR